MSEHRYVICYDLEMNQPSERIIEIGAVRGDIFSGEIVDSFDILINPHEELAVEIAELTGLGSEQLKREGIDFKDAFELFLHWSKKEGDTFRLLCQWGIYDLQLLRKQYLESLGEGAKEGAWPYGSRWLDVKSLAQAYCLANGLTPYGSMSKFGRRMHIKVEESRSHRAIYDAEMTFKIFHKLSLLLQPQEGNALQEYINEYKLASRSERSSL